MTRLVLFDIDGTLIRTGGAGVKAFERAFALEFNLRDATRGVSFAGRTDPSLVRQCFLQHGVPPTRENFRRFFDAYIFLLAHMLEQCHGGVCCGVPEFIQGLTSLPNPPRLGLLTGNVRLGAEVKLRYYQLWHHFEVGAFGDDNEDRNCLAGVAQQRGSFLSGRPLRGEDILVIGDTPLDIECGNSIQAKVLAVATGGFKLPDLKAHRPTWAVETLQLVTPAQVCGSPTAPHAPPSRSAPAARAN